MAGILLEFPCLVEGGTVEADLVEGSGKIGLEDASILLFEEACGTGIGLEVEDITEEGDIEEEEKGG